VLAVFARRRGRCGTARTRLRGRDGAAPNRWRGSGGATRARLRGCSAIALASPQGRNGAARTLLLWRWWQARSRRSMARSRGLS
jgi:hypothetical protein